MKRFLPAVLPPAFFLSNNYFPHAKGASLSAARMFGVAHVPGNILQGNWTAAIYISDQASKTVLRAGQFLLVAIDVAQEGGAIRNEHGIISRFGRASRDAMQGARRSHGEPWRRRATPQCARQAWNTSENYSVLVP